METDFYRGINQGAGRSIDMTDVNKVTQVRRRACFKVLPEPLWRFFSGLKEAASLSSLPDNDAWRRLLSVSAAASGTLRLRLVAVPTAGDPTAARSLGGGRFRQEEGSCDVPTHTSVSPHKLSPKTRFFSSTSRPWKQDGGEEGKNPLIHLRRNSE